MTGFCHGAGEIHVEVGTALVVLSGFPQPGQGERPHVARDIRLWHAGSSRSVSVARGGARPAGRAVSTSGRGSGVDAGRELRSPLSWAARPAGGGPGGAGLRLCRQGGIRHCDDPRPDRAARGRRGAAPPVAAGPAPGRFRARRRSSATRRPGDPATRRPGDPATRRPGDPATRRPGDPATRRPGFHYTGNLIRTCQAETAETARTDFARLAAHAQARRLQDRRFRRAQRVLIESSQWSSNPWPP